jgi:RNA polymerase sigma-70 factor (ECF subfamily)
VTGAAPTGEELFLQLWRGDAGAFRVVHSRYGARVAAIARRCLGRQLRARLETIDLTQDVWMVVAREAPAIPFANERQFLAWVAAVVQRRVQREARRWSCQCRHREREATDSNPETQADRRAERPSQIVLREEAASRMNAALARLEGEDREVLVLRHLLGLPWRDVAVALDVTEACAQMRCTRARRRLAQLVT